jgi:hypothetical protein
MTDSSNENSMEEENDKGLTIEHDDITVNTATTATKKDYIKQKMDESIIIYEIPYRKGHVCEDNFKLHTQLLQ